MVQLEGEAKAAQQKAIQAEHERGAVQGEIPAPAPAPGRMRGAA
jgi:hypothetical protein